jgi:peptidyl-prolyl cis-trans isomerase C
MAQVTTQPLVGLPLPAIQADASLSATLAMFDQFAGTIVAEVGTRTVTWGDVADAIRAMPAIVSGLPIQQIYQNATGQLMQQKALALAAEKAGLHRTVSAQRRMQNAADDALGHELLRRSLTPNTAENSLRAIYDGAMAGKPGPDQVRARIIMVESQEAASGLIQRLRMGADFSALARDFSRDATATEGGDLGYARLDMLTPELGAVVFALAPGQMTAFPVRSGSYWFIIKVEGRSQLPSPSFEEARTALERDVVHAGVPQLRRQALDNASVTYHGLVGKQAAVQPQK